MTYMPPYPRYRMTDTPQDIYDETLIETGTAVDVFELTIGSLVYDPTTVIDDLVAQAWEKFGRRPIGEYDYEYWMEVFNDAVKYNYRWYVKALPLILASDLTEMNDGSIVVTGSEIIALDEVVNSVVDSDGTTGNTNRATGTVGVSGSYSNTNSGTIKEEQEVTPMTTASSTYLNGRNTTTDTTALANSHTDTTTNNLTNTDAGTNTQDTETDTTRNEDTVRTNNSTTINKNKSNITFTLEITKQLEELNDVFLSRLDKYFLNRW